MKIRILVYPLLIMGVLLILAISCKKNDSITKKDVTITWANPADITVGTLLSATQLNATADVPGTFVYTPAIGASLAVGANQDLKVDFKSTDATDYNTATKTVMINVTKITPTITWASPTSILLGTPLSATQLNATADVAGAFVYTPPIGTSLNVGDNQYLKVDFTPIDVTNYNKTSKTIKINMITGTVTDFDGNVYNTVAIGTQVWMKGNLKTTHYSNGTAIPLVDTKSTWALLTATSKAYCWYGDDILYTWVAAMNGAASATSNPSSIQGVCPTGWHLPSDAEWTQLISYLGDESVAGGKLKEKGTTNWATPNSGATNETGFTALPGGCRSGGGSYDFIGYHGCWWSASEYDATNAWYLRMSFNFDDVFRSNDEKEVGFSVRCVRD